MFKRRKTSRELSRETLTEAFAGTGTSQYLTDQLEAAIDAHDDDELSMATVREMVAPANAFAEASHQAAEAAQAEHDGDTGIAVAANHLQTYLRSFEAEGFRYANNNTVTMLLLPDTAMIVVTVADDRSASMVPTKFAGYSVMSVIDATQTS